MGECDSAIMKITIRNLILIPEIPIWKSGRNRECSTQNRNVVYSSWTFGGNLRIEIIILIEAAGTPLRNG